jgi:hypothetical protein
VEREIVAAAEDASGPSDNDSPADEVVEPSTSRGFFLRAYNLKSALRNFREKVGLNPSSTVKGEPIISPSIPQDDPERGSNAEGNENNLDADSGLDARRAEDPQAKEPDGENAGSEGTALIEPFTSLSTGDNNIVGVAEYRPTVDASRAGGVEGAGSAGSLPVSENGSAPGGEIEIHADGRIESIGRGLRATRPQIDPPASRLETRTGGEEGGDALESCRAAETGYNLQETSQAPRQHDRSRPRRPRVRWESLDDDLIRGYLLPAKPGEAPPLQLRRTLDQYFYTHLASTSDRDNDQVVYRYTRRNPEPKMFMVDQLWLWILNEGIVFFSEFDKFFALADWILDTVISCCPQRWGLLSGGRSNEADRHDTPHAPGTFTAPPALPRRDYDPFCPRAPGMSTAPPAPRTRDYIVSESAPFRSFSSQPTGHQTKVQSKSRSKSRHKDSGVPDWILGGRSKTKPSRNEKSRKERKFDFIVESRPSSAEEKRRRSAFLQTDPLNVHQSILKYLQGSARPPVTSVYDIATIIADTCVNVFDQYQVPDDYQFFDFFERSIGIVVSYLQKLPTL